MPVTSVLLAFIVLDGSIIEIGVKIVIISPLAFLLSGWTPWLDTILFSIGCGLVALALTAIMARLLFNNRVAE